MDGKESVSLAKLFGPKPLVLVLGNFSCGPFRSLYPDVEAVYERWKDDHLVIDNWFAYQATSPLPSALAAVVKLTRHPLFSIKNPNKVAEGQQIVIPTPSEAPPAEVGGSRVPSTSP